MATATTVSAKAPAKGRTRDRLKILTGDDITNLVESPQISRFQNLNADHVEHLAWRIATEGQSTPVNVRTGPNGKFELVAGRHRKAAVLLINEDPSRFDLDAPIGLLINHQEMTDEEAAKLSFAENTGLPLTVMDLAMSAHHYSKLGWDNVKIAAHMTTSHQKISPSRVSQLRTYIRLPHSIQMSLHAGRIPESAVKALVSLELEREEQEEIAERLEKGEMRAVELTQRAANEKRGKGKKVKRSLYDLLSRLKEMESDRAVNLLAWLDGEVQGDDVLEDIFGDTSADK